MSALKHRSLKHLKPAPPPADLPFRDEKQVLLDLNRLQLTKAASSRLLKRIKTVLQSNPELHYYQGYHDISQHTKSTKQLETLSLKHLRDFMCANFTPTLMILQLVPELIITADPDGLGLLLREDDNEDGVKSKGFFALPSVVTLFSHQCGDSEVIMFLIDKVMEFGLSYAIYFYVALCLKHSDLIYSKLGKQCDDEHVHMAFQEVGEYLVLEDLPELDKSTQTLLKRVPLQTLTKYKQISEYSVLKTGNMRNKGTIRYTIKQLEKTPCSESRRFMVTPVVAMSVAISAIAVGMVYTKFRKQ